MTRDKELDSIFLRNFFRDSIGFFTKEKPQTKETFLFRYNLATNDWIPLQKEIDTYPLANAVKEDLSKLFDLAENFYYLVVGSDQPYWSDNISQRWIEIRNLAIKIYSSYPSQG